MIATRLGSAALITCENRRLTRSLSAKKSSGVIWLGSARRSMAAMPAVRTASANGAMYAQFK